MGKTGLHCRSRQIHKSGTDRLIKLTLEAGCVPPAHCFPHSHLYNHPPFFYSSLFNHQLFILPPKHTLRKIHTPHPHWLNHSLPPNSQNIRLSTLKWQIMQWYSSPSLTIVAECFYFEIPFFFLCLPSSLLFLQVRPTRGHQWRSNLKLHWTPTPASNQTSWIWWVLYFGQSGFSSGVLPSIGGMS